MNCLKVSRRGYSTYSGPMLCHCFFVDSSSRRSAASPREVAVEEQDAVAELKLTPQLRHGYRAAAISLFTQWSRGLRRLIGELETARSEHEVKYVLGRR